MNAPKVTLDDIVIVTPSGYKENRMTEIVTAEWHTGYSQWLFNKDNGEFYESQIEFWFDDKKNKWRKYKF